MRIAFRRFATTLLLFISSASAALAVRDNTGLGSSANVAGFNTSAPPLAVIVGNLVSGLLALLGSVFVVLIIYGGFVWMTAQGEPDKIKKAKSIITGAIIGVVIIFTSYAITQAVISVIASPLETAG